MMSTSIFTASSFTSEQEMRAKALDLAIYANTNRIKLGKDDEAPDEFASRALADAKLYEAYIEGENGGAE